MSESGFRNGEWVEVTSDEEGFRGAWFIAKILTLPLGWNDDAAAAAAAAASSASKNKKKTLQRRKDEFLVVYKSITEEKRRTKRLKEYVHTSCVRPLPPKEPVRLFELNEWVDAFDLDAWWKGVVTKVFENEFKYTVYFQTTEEKKEYLQSEVRVHLDWTDGKWSKPRRLQPQQQQEIKQDDAEEGSKKKKNVKKRGRSSSKEKTPSEQGKETDNKRSIRSSKKRRGNDATKEDKVKDKGSGLKAFGPQASNDADMLITEEVLRDIADEPQSPPVTDNEELASRKNPSVVSTRVLSNIADEYQSPPIIDNKGKLASKSNSAATEEDPAVRTEISRDNADEHQSSPMLDNKEISPDKLSQSNEVATKEGTLLKDLEIPESFNLTKSPEEDTCIGTLCNEAIKEQNEMGPASVDNQCKDSRKVEKEVTLAFVYNRVFGTRKRKSSGLGCDDASAKQNQMKESSVNHETRKECDEVHPEAPVIGSTNDKVSDNKESGLKAFCPQASYDADMSIAEVLRDIADEPQSPPVTDNKELASRKNPSVVSTRVLSKLVSKSNSAATEEDPPVRTEISRDTADEHQSSPMLDNKEISPDKLSQSNEVATKDDTLLKDLEIPESLNLTKSPEEDTCIGTLCNEAIKEQNEMGSASVDNQCKDSRKVEKEVTLASVYNRRDDASAKQNQMKESSVNHETRKECDEVHPEAPVIGSTNDKVSVENESLPFVKASLMWEKIFAMEIFQKMPQAPHFRPLEQYNMAQREGMAIGHMVTFSNVAEKTRASHIDDPSSNLEEISKALVDLEAHGFNVQAIQSRVERLLEIKDEQLMLEAEVKKSIELKNEMETQLDKVKENLRFQEEATIRYKNEQKVLMKEIDKFESDTNVCLMELDESVKLEYPRVAGGPW